MIVLSAGRRTLLRNSWRYSGLQACYRKTPQKRGFPILRSAPVHLRCITATTADAGLSRRDHMRVDVEAHQGLRVPRAIGELACRHPLEVPEREREREREREI